MTNLDPRDALVTHLPALRVFALRLTRNRFTADDMMQHTVLKAWANMDKFNPGTNMRAWLFTILHNNFYSGCRTLSHEVADVDNFFRTGFRLSPITMADCNLCISKSRLTNCLINNARR
jgi:RNA polymerase sigma-70 factor (ECF subfamily)